MKTKQPVQLMTNLKKVLEGKSKAQAKGVKRQGIKGVGLAIIAAMDAVNTTVRDAICKFAKSDEATRLRAVKEVEDTRAERVEACNGERKQKKIASVRSSFARVLTIMRAINNGEQVDKITKAKSLAEMYAFASRQVGHKVNSNKPLTDEQVAEINKRIQRICPTIPGRQATDAQKGRYADELARLEQHLVATLQALQKHEHLTIVPVKTMLQMARAKGKHIRAIGRQAA